MRFCNLTNDWILEEMRCLNSMVEIHFDISSRAEAAVGCHSDAFFLDKVDQRFLYKIRVVLDLKGCGTNASVAKEIQDYTDIEVADSQGFDKANVHKGFHGFPCFSNGCIGCLDIGWSHAVMIPTWWIANRW